ALAEMVVVETALLVVEADPQFFPVVVQLHLQRLARRQALRRGRQFSLEKQGEGMSRLPGQGEGGGGAAGLKQETIGAVDVLARLVAAAVDAAAGPDAHHVALADSPLDVQRDLRPGLLADDGLEEVLRNIVSQHPALHLPGREKCRAKK